MYFQSVKQDIIYIGLPPVSLERTKEKYTVIRSDDKEITIKPNINNCNNQTFEDWKTTLLTVPDQNPIPITNVRMSDTYIANKVRMFNLESKTPMQCLLFLADLKKEING